MNDVDKAFWPEMKVEQYRRRNISGIYIFDKFPDEEKRQPTCIEDCQQETRRAWLMRRGDTDYAKQAITMVYDAFIDLCDYLHKEGCIKDKWHKDFTEMADKKKKETKYNWALHELASLLDVACDKLCLCADACGVVKGGKQ